MNQLEELAVDINAESLKREGRRIAVYEPKTQSIRVNLIMPVYGMPIRAVLTISSINEFNSVKELYIQQHKREEVRR